MQLAIGVSGLSGTMADLATHSRQNADGAELAASDADQGVALFREAMTSIDSVSGALHSTEQSVAEVTDQVKKIGVIIKQVGTIAQQSRLLSLNAAIEAAHATDGRSAAFSVVAREVRDLSDETRNLAMTIENMLNQLRKTSDDSGALICKTRERVQDGANKVSAVGDTIKKLGNVARALVSTTRTTAADLDTNASLAEGFSRQLNVSAVQIVGG
jgi:methyl-accepting chemotaxis protein